MKKVFLSFGLFLVFVLSACSSDNSTKTLRVVTNANFPPYEYIGDGQYIGIDIELAKQIADELNMKTEIQNIDFSSIISTVANGQADVGISALTVTEDRNKIINFSNSYATSKQVIIVKEDSPIKSLDDLYTGVNYRVGAQLATTGAIYFGEDIANKKTKASLQEYHNGADAVAALIAGKIDCVIIDDKPANSFIASNDGLKILSTEYIEEKYAIAVSKENIELLKKINIVLKKLKANGDIDKIIKKHIK